MMRHLLLLLFLTVLGCSDAEAERLRRVGDKTYDRVTQAAEEVGHELGQTLLDQKPAEPAAAPVADVAERVRQRLAWDRELEGLSLQVTVEGETVTLKGQVKSEGQKQRAVELAEKTVGVAKVIVELEVAATEKSEPEGLP